VIRQGQIRWLANGDVVGQVQFIHPLWYRLVDLVTGYSPLSLAATALFASDPSVRLNDCFGGDRHAMEKQLHVGFAGLGIMGAPMAANLLKAGFPLIVYNRTRSRCDALIQRGAAGCASLLELAARSDVVITMVSDTPDVESVLFQKVALAAGLRPGSVVIDMSTISPRATVEFARRLADQSVAMLDAPVSGGESGAITGTLSIMVGGDRAVFQRCLPVLQAIGKNIVYTGTNGSGQKTKLVNQVVGSLNLLATIEGLRLASAAGLDLHQTISAVGAGAAGSWMLANLGPKIAAGDFGPGFFLRLHQKDLRLAAEFFQDLGIQGPGTELTYRLFTEAVERGMGEYGNQGLYKLWS
jgi:3-hydroxyisobutyrate dehydrogenase